MHNPTGEGVRAISAQVQAKAVKVLEKANNNNNCSEEFSAGSKKFTAAATVSTSTTSSSSQQHHSDGLQQQHETKTKEGTAKRNITRKKTADKDTGNFNSCFKKQGGAGKAQWQQDKDEEISNYYVQAADMEAVDEKDPMYDVAQDLNQYILTSHAPIPPSLSSQPTTATPPSAGGASSASDQKRGTDPCTSKAVYGPLWTVTEFKLRLAECIREYFDSCDTDEVIRTISELKCREYHATEIVKKTISLAMDQGPRERELTSRLLTCLHPNPMSRLELQVGFGMLLDSMDELCKDVPDAKVRNVWLCGCP